MFVAIIGQYEARLRLWLKLAIRFAAPPMRLDAGERLGPYEILEPFGAGGIGEVKTVSLDRGVSLEALAAKYPRSNRAGCAIVELAQMSTGNVREQYLKRAIDEHADDWFENGAQVGPLAMAFLAMHYAGLDRLSEAERLAAELSARYPESVDSTGASLDEVLPGPKFLRPPR
jgi:hypothetical protein